jgi:hypothetical protein
MIPNVYKYIMYILPTEESTMTGFWVHNLPTYMYIRKKASFLFARLPLGTGIFEPASVDVDVFIPYPSSLASYFSHENCTESGIRNPECRSQSYDPGSFNYNAELY